MTTPKKPAIDWKAVGRRLRELRGFDMNQAEFARQIGISDIPLLCARELDVDGGVGLCVRVLAHLYTSKEPADLRHVYLEGAKPLRTDLPQ